MATSKKVSKESDLFKPVVELLKNMGFTKAYGEVCDVDIYAHDSNNVTISVELKKSLNVKVLSQALDNVPSSHYSYVAVPYVKGVRDHWKLFKKLGIGLIVVKDGKAVLATKAKLNQPRRTLIKYIMPHHGRTVGGKKSGENPTAYSETMDRVIEYLQGNPMATIDQIFESVETHYNGKNKKSSLRNALNAKWNNDRIGIRKVGNKTLYYYKGEE